MAFVLRFSILFLGMLLSISGTSAEEERPVKDHGVFGALFEIAEEDMIEALKNKLQKLHQNGQLDKVEDSLKQKAKTRLETPTLVQGLRPTQVERTFIHDPTLVIESDIKDHEGHVLAHKGQRLNPLTVHKPSQGLLFIDGDEEAQKQWAKHHADRFILILVRGKPLDVEKDLGVPVYFDQGGVLCRQYHIEQIPARIDVEGETLRVTEFKVSL